MAADEAKLERAPSEEGRELFAKRDVHVCDIAEEAGMTKGKLLDNLLLVLSDALFLAQSEACTK